MEDGYLWVNLGHLTNTVDYVRGHGRLLRSLRFNDDDYLTHSYDAIVHILDAAPENLATVLAYEPIANWMLANEAKAFEELGGGLDERDLPAAEITTSVAIVDAAIADAQALINNGGHGRAIDRVHTALHGYLEHLCLMQGVGFDAPPAPKLLKLLMETHPAFADDGPRKAELLLILRSLANVVDKLGTLRNNNSPAHPNDELLGKAEARLVINSAKTVLAYLVDKLDSKATFR